MAERWFIEGIDIYACTPAKAAYQEKSRNEKNRDGDYTILQ